MRKEYKIVGTSKVKPIDLPDGLAVEETEVEITEVITTGLSREITVTESATKGASHIKLENTSQFRAEIVQAFLSPDVTRKLRDTLTEIIGDGKSGLRKVVDDSGYADIWFEIEPDKFYNQSTRKDAQRLADRGAPYRSLDDLRSSYRVKTITFE